MNAPGSCWNETSNRIAFASDRENRDEIWTAAPDGSGLSCITMHFMPNYHTEPSFSPDGQWIAFECDMPTESEDDRRGSIWKVRADGSEVVRLTDGVAEGTDDRQPNWSPKGDRILFQRRSPGTQDWNIYTISPDGTHLRQVTKFPSSDTDASWSPDGRWIVFSSDYGDIAMPNIYVIPAGGGEPVRVTKNESGEDGAPSWSPDGNWIAFESYPGRADKTPATLWRIRVPSLN